MKIFGNIFVGLIGLAILFMFRFVSERVSRYDIFVAAFLSLVFLVCFFAVFAAITWTGKLDFSAARARCNTSASPSHLSA